MAHIEPIIGRYVHVEIDGIDHRIAFEEAGEGVPLVCLHTAGADSRQYRHLLNDPGITDRFRVIAFDMPRHGKSLPPDGHYDEDYALGRRSYQEIIAAFCRALELDRPVLLGCSMGGYILLDIAIDAPGAYRGLIAVQPRAYAPAWTAFNDLLDRPEMDIHSFLAVVRAVSARVSPPERRKEVEWVYSQAGPGVLAGDFTYAGDDHDTRGRMGGIDAAASGLYVIAGDWDMSCLPEHTDELAAAIPGLPVVRIPDAGHFPPAEHPEAFRAALLPILDRLAG